MPFRPFRLLFDAAAISTVLAGARRVGNYEVNTDQFENTTLRQTLNMFVSGGDWILDTVISQMEQYPQHFPHKAGEKVASRAPTAGSQASTIGRLLGWSAGTSSSSDSK
ncbi:hypothetical protein CXG81DRAFT_24897 [Caulochytrium protostelioides]|uniref:Uncharacterized protein n=1 Tax=Caulochytrium protostelioides TaxID=1555241 RepID=A0A4P9XAS2_9FUNG|nr:hypothetical protein CXG81DRAFT_24897 [Caulochytrium protostelioides]|eukprot:RKP02435.1 hypothetical protein CXG81DRAFT_24897 [Caulochytrium protostelioides]